MGLLSMTGYGSAECSGGGVIVRAEVRSVNHKQLDIRLILPDLPLSVEGRVTQCVRERVARGFITCRVRINRSKKQEGMIVDELCAAAWLKRMRSLGKRLGLKDDLTLGGLMEMPGVIRARSPEEEFEDAGPLLFECLKRALSVLVVMRRAEGKALCSDIGRRIAALSKLTDRIEARAPAVLNKYLKIMRSRLKSAGVSDPGVRHDIVSIADKSDITEEIVRLRSHIRQFLGKLSSSGPVGRTLDFLAQEMHREINTIGSKASDSKIVREVVQFKSELERVREQIQNVE